jgi:hypothetical protein
VAFKKIDIPLSFCIKPISEITSVNQLVSELKSTEANDTNALLCFNHGALVDDANKDWGHIVVFDRIIDGQLRIIDPSPDYPKWRLVDAGKMFEAMKKHGEKKTAAGIWFLTKL